MRASTLRLAHLLPCGLIMLGLTSCMGSQSTTPVAATSAIEPCEALRTLTKSYQQQFQDIRKAQRAYERITIWSTNYQIIGSGCEIWGWQGGNYNYVCNYVAPDEDTAEDVYQRARTTIRNCLSADWQLREQALPNGPGSKAVFKQPRFSGVVDLRKVQTRGIGRPHWAIYLMIGDYNSQI